MMIFSYVRPVRLLEICALLIRTSNPGRRYHYHLPKATTDAFANTSSVTLNELKSIEDMDKHMVFVYGTLKTGEPNHYLLKSKLKNGEITLIGKATTVKKWPLVIASRYNIPFLLRAEGLGKHVKGEVYCVDSEMLNILDEFENHPVLYERAEEDVILHTNSQQGLSVNETKLTVWMYFLKTIQQKLLQLPFLEEYSSKGSHGSEYTEGEDLKFPEDI